jgi:hypothetical protein
VLASQVERFSLKLSFALTLVAPLRDFHQNQFSTSLQMQVETFQEQIPATFETD